MSGFILLKSDCPICGGVRNGKKKHDCKSSGELVHCFSHNDPPHGWVHVGESAIGQSMYAPDKGDSYDPEKHRAELAKLRAEHKAREAKKRLQLPTISDRNQKILSLKAELTESQNADLLRRGLTQDEIDFDLSQHWLFAAKGGYGITAVDPVTGMLCGAQKAKDDRSKGKYTWGIFTGQNKLKETGENPLAVWRSPDFDPNKPYEIEFTEGYLKPLIRAQVRWRKNSQVIVIGAAGGIFGDKALQRVLSVFPKPKKLTLLVDADSQNLKKKNLYSGYKNLVKVVQSVYDKGCNNVQLKFADWGQWRDKSKGDCDEYFGRYRRRSPYQWLRLFEFEETRKCAKERLAQTTQLTADKVITLKEFQALKDDDPGITAQQVRASTNNAQDVALVAPTASGKTTIAEHIASEYEYGLAPMSRNSLVKDGGRRMGFSDRHDLDNIGGQLIGHDGFEDRVAFCNEAYQALERPISDILKHENITVGDEFDHSLKSLKLSSTHGKDRKRKLNTDGFWRQFRESDRTLIMSADITDYEVAQFRRQTGRKPFVLKVMGTKKQRVEVVFEDQAEWWQQFFKSRREGQRIIVKCSYKSDAEFLQDQFGAIAIHADNAKEYQDFLENPDKWLELHKPEIIAVSPILATGFSIEGDHFDAVFKLIHENISAESTKQFGDRYRPNVPHYTWVAETNHQYDLTTTDAVLSRKLAQAKASDNDEQPFIDKDDPFFYYKAQENWSKANLRADYLARCEADIENVIYQYCSLSQSEIEAINRTVSEHRSAFKEAELTKDAEADNLTPEQAEQYRQDEQSLTQSQRRALRKYDLAHWKVTTPDQLTVEDFRVDKKGRRRKALENLERQAFPQIAITTDKGSIEGQKHGVSIQDVTHHHLRVRDLNNIGIGKILDFVLSGEEWDNNHPIVKETADICRSKRDELKKSDITFTCGKNANNAAYFGSLLKSLGIKTVRKQKRIDGVVVSFYQLDHEYFGMTKADLVARLPRLQEKFEELIVNPENQWVQGLYGCHTPFENINKQGCVTVDNPLLDISESPPQVTASYQGLPSPEKLTKTDRDSSLTKKVLGHQKSLKVTTLEKDSGTPEYSKVSELKTYRSIPECTDQKTPTLTNINQHQPKFSEGQLVWFSNGVQWLQGTIERVITGVRNEYNVLDSRGWGLFVPETAIAPM